MRWVIRRFQPNFPSDQALLLSESIRIAEQAAGHALPRSAVSKYWSAKASAYIAAEPLDWLALLGLKLKNFWSHFRYDDLGMITALRDAGIVLPGLHFGLVAALGLPGALFAFRYRKARWILAAIALQMIALLPAFVNERYRLPVAPALLLLGSFFLVELWDRATSWRAWRPLAFALAAVALSTWFVSRTPSDPALLSLDNFKAGRRQLLANDFARAEHRLRLAAAVAVPAPEVDRMVASLFVRSAREKWEAGDKANANRTLAEARRIDPTFRPPPPAP